MHRLLIRATVLSLVTATPAMAAEGGELPRIVNFAILAAILYWVLAKPLTGFLQARTEQIRSELSDAADKTSRAAVELKKADDILASVEDEIAKAKEEARRAAEAERDRILKAAEAEAARIKDIARKEIAAEVEAGRRRLLARAAELSVDLAHKKLASTMTKEDQSKLIDRSIAMMEKAK
jgi:F-type H+-transporting ATPase subunit b